MSARIFRRFFLPFFILAFGQFFLFPPSGGALEFGINKVRYHTDHQWNIYQSAHFEVYYYQGCESLAQTTTQYAEKAFLKISKMLDYVPKTKIPLFIYGTSAEFQETNISPEFLPEGVGGFTEVFKNRIAIPMSGSYYELEKVITHELTHAFQYDLIYGEGWRSINLFKSVLVPTWMMEGMAEWTAQHWEAQGEMVLRDAVLNDGILPLNLLDSFGHFEQVYMAYKESHSILEYVSQIYGSEKVVQMMKKMTQNQPPGAVIKNTLGVTMDELYDNWRFYVKSQAWNRVNGMVDPGRYGEVLQAGAVKSAISPDGKKLAYLTGGELALIVVPGGQKSSLLNRPFQTQGSGLAWSPDGGLLAVIFRREGEYGLYAYNLSSRKLQEFHIPALPLIYSPSWSPDGKYLVFSGFDHQTDDLYRYELQSGRTERLTHDSGTESWPQFSPDGSALYFIGEEEGETSIQKIPLDPRGLPAGNAEPVGRDLGFVTSLRVRKEGLVFTSNGDRGIFNLFRMDLAGRRLTQVSDSFADILSADIAPDGSRYYVNIYQKAKENLYAFQAERLEEREASAGRFSYLSNSFSGAGKIISPPPGFMETQSQQDHFQKPELQEVEPSGEAKAPPTKPPAAVEHLQVAESSNLVQLQWKTPDPELQRVDSYRVYRSTSAGASFTCVGTSLQVKSGKYADFNVQNDQTYFYYVTAVNQVGEGPPSGIVEAHPVFQIQSQKYNLSLSPDILLFLAGYDSSFGFVGGGAIQMSDYLGDHRLSILGDSIPTVRTGLEVNYEFSHWRTTVDFDFFYFQNFFRVFDLQTGEIVNQYRNNENGLGLNFTYPLNTATRVEYGVGTQRFQGSPLYLRFSEGISNYFQNSDQWNVANFYRLAFVQDKRKAGGFWPAEGYSVNFTLLHAPPVFDSNVSFANVLLETQFYADLDFLNHLVWANRVIGMTSQGRNPQTFFIGPDQPFQAYFTTLRGYGGNIYFGSNLALWSTELRYPVVGNLNFVLPPLDFLLIKNIELAAFMDSGLISNQIQNLPSSPLLNSVGAGIRFYAFLFERALVLLRFDVAWRNDQNAPPTFHFNLIPMF